MARGFEDGYLESGEVAASVGSGGDFGEADARMVFNRSYRLFQLARHCCRILLLPLSLVFFVVVCFSL